MWIFEDAVKYKSIIFISQRKSVDLKDRIAVQIQLHRAGAKREEKHLLSILSHSLC